jgi:hypothetical protein
MTAIGPVSIASVGQVASPPQSAGAKGTLAAPPVPGQGTQGDILSISSQGLKALEDSKKSLLVLEKHHHRHQEVDLVLLTYPNFQVNGNRPAAVQVQQDGAAQPGGQAQPAAVASVGPAGGAGGAGRA